MEEKELEEIFNLEIRIADIFHLHLSRLMSFGNLMLSLSSVKDNQDLTDGIAEDIWVVFDTLISGMDSEITPLIARQRDIFIEHKNKNAGQ
jgi:hypothetical protein